jgi:hypothetical protein
MKPRRALFVAVLVAVVAAAAAVGNAARARPEAATVPPVASGLPAHTSPAGSVWFCPGFPSALPASDDRVTLANVGDTPADVVVTVLPDTSQPQRTTITVGASSITTKRRAELGPPGALTIEAFGGRVVVEEGIDGRAGVDVGPCATHGGTQWQFAAGETPRGVQQWLVIQNPFASDAKVDVTLRTSAGVRQPELLQSFDVRRRSRAVIAMHDIAVREDQVAVQVDARVGRVVVAQTLVYTADTPQPGIATTVGMPAAADRWFFADGTNVPGATTRVAIANVGPDDAQVDVQILPENRQASAAVTLTVAQNEVVWAQLGGCTPAAGGGNGCVPVPPNVRYAVEVGTAAGGEIVAQTLTRGSQGSAQPGAATSLGAAQPARSWVFARDRVDSERSTTLAISNPFDQPARVDITVMHDGRVEHPRALQGITVAPGRRASVSIVGGPRPSTTPSALVVDASAPVMVERSIIGATDVSRSPGTPVN